MQMSDSRLHPLLQAVRRALVPVAEVQAALVFGSHASGRARTDSDIDVAVLLAPEAARLPALERTRALLAALGRELAADHVDLVVLNEAPPALAFQVLKHGRVAFEREPSALHRFRVRTYARHADFELVERFFRDVTRRRALAHAAGEGNRG